MVQADIWTKREEAVPTDSSTSGGRHRASHCRVQEKCRQKTVHLRIFPCTPRSHCLLRAKTCSYGFGRRACRCLSCSESLFHAITCWCRDACCCFRGCWRQFHVVGCRSGKASRSLSSSGASLQSNFDEPDGWNSDVSQTHTVPNTINPGEGEAAEHMSVLPSVSNDVYATWKRRNRQTQRRHVKVFKHAEREAKRELMAQLEIIHATDLQTLQGMVSRSVQILWQTLWLKHLRTILEEIGGPA